MVSKNPRMYATLLVLLVCAAAYFASFQTGSFSDVIATEYTAYAMATGRGNLGRRNGRHDPGIATLPTEWRNVEVELSKSLGGIGRVGELEHCDTSFPRCARRAGGGITRCRISIVGARHGG